MTLAIVLGLLACGTPPGEPPAEPVAPGVVGLLHLVRYVTPAGADDRAHLREVALESGMVATYDGECWELWLADGAQAGTACASNGSSPTPDGRWVVRGGEGLALHRRPTPMGAPRKAPDPLDDRRQLVWSADVALAHWPSEVLPAQRAHPPTERIADGAGAVRAVAIDDSGRVFARSARGTWAFAGDGHPEAVGDAPALPRRGLRSPNGHWELRVRAHAAPARHHDGARCSRRPAGELAAACYRHATKRTADSALSTTSRMARSA